MLRIHSRWKLHRGGKHRYALLVNEQKKCFTLAVAESAGQILQRGQIILNGQIHQVAQGGEVRLQFFPQLFCGICTLRTTICINLLSRALSDELSNKSSFSAMRMVSWTLLSRLPTLNTGAVGHWEQQSQCANFRVESRVVIQRL